MNNTDYLHNIIKDLTDVLWEEHGRGAKYRTTLVGVNYFQSKYGEKLIKNNVKETLEAVLYILKDENIIEEASYEQEDEYVLNIRFRSCIHLETEKELLNTGLLNIINCPCANAVAHFLGKLTGKYCEIANLEIENNECKATIVVMMDS